MRNKTILEASALWNLYYNEKGYEIVEYVINQTDILCATASWSELELFRATMKRFNQKEITKKEKDDLLNFIEYDLSRLKFSNQIVIIDLDNKILSLTKQLIREYNLFASDAVHLATAINTESQLFLVDDYHFKRLDKNIEKNFSKGI